MSAVEAIVWNLINLWLVTVTTIEDHGTTVLVFVGGLAVGGIAAHLVWRWLRRPGS